MSGHVKIVTRPQFIKAAVVPRALNTVGGVQEVLAHTLGEDRQMTSDQLMKQSRD